MRISIVIPVYNNSSTIAELNSRLVNLLPKHFSSFEILYVDDGSTDETANKLMNLSINPSCPISIIRLKKNYGQHFATLCGIFFSKGSVIITIDADMTEDICFIPELNRQLKETNADVAYVVFDRRKRYGLGWKYVFSQLFLIIARVFGAKNYSSFRAISSHVKQNIMLQRHRFFVIEGMFIDSGCTLAYFFVDTFSEKDNASAYTFIKRIIFTTSLFIEYKPFYFFTILWGILISLSLGIDISLPILLVLHALLFLAAVAYLYHRLLAPRTIDQINNSVKDIHLPYI